VVDRPACLGGQRSDHVLRRGLVRVADPEVDEVGALPLQLAFGCAKLGECVRRYP